MQHPGRHGKARRISALIAGLLLGAGATAQTIPAEPAALKPRVFDTRTAPGFGDPRLPLRAYLSADTPRPRGVQHVCLVGYEDGSDRWAQIHWQEGRRLIRWTGGHPDYPDDTTGLGRDDLHLDRDVVATEADINSSTYLVTRAWADGVIADCARAGVRYTVVPLASKGK
jgi:hypothetical protein